MARGNQKMANPKLTKAIIEAAIHGFEEQKREIDAQITELRAMLMGETNEHAGTAVRRPRRKRSAAARKAMAEAQRRRWAAVRANSTAPKTRKKSKRKLSAEGRAAIVAALKKRWAAKKAAANK